MPGYNDCYVLAPARSATVAASFLEEFLSEREASFAPEDPSEVLGLPLDFQIVQVLQHLEIRLDTGYSMYFKNKMNEEPAHAALMFQEDGSLFLMLSVEADKGTDFATKWTNRIREFASAEYSYWGWEAPPVDGEAAFKERALVYSSMKKA